MINTMKHYYLINGKVMKGSDMPNVMINHPNYNDIMMTWKKSLQPCEISESELDKVENKVYTFNNCHADNPIDVTDIVEEIYCKCNCGESFIEFKQPKQVDEYGYIKCGDCNKFYLCTNCGAQCGSEGHFIEPKQVDGEVEAVEFAEWIQSEKWVYNKGLYYKGLSEQIIVTTKQLYEIFKNRK